MTVLMTSLAEIRSFNPCALGWRAILAGQNKTEADDVLFPLVECLESNSVADVCWLLGKRKNEIQIAVRFAKMCADSVKHLCGDAAMYADAAAMYADDAMYAATSAYVSASAAASAAAMYAAAASVDAANTYAARKEQENKNKQFLIQCINEFTQSEPSSW